jgi:Ran GTPase-activating protein 1
MSSSNTDFLTLLGEREVVDTAEHARNLVAEALQPLQSASDSDEPLVLKGVKISNKSFSPEAATALVEELRGLARLEGLEVLDMSDIIASKPEQVALETLQIVCDAFTTCPLKEVNVSDNALGEKGIGPCRGVLENQPALERLFICNNGMSAYAASVV